MGRKYHDIQARRQAIFHLLKGTKATTKDIFAAIKTEFKDINLYNIRDDLRMMTDSKHLEVFPGHRGHELLFQSNPEKKEFKWVRTWWLLNEKQKGKHNHWRKTAGTRNTPLQIAMRKKRQSINVEPLKVTPTSTKQVLEPKLPKKIEPEVDNLDKIAAIWAVLLEKPVNRHMAHTMLTIANTLV